MEQQLHHGGSATEAGDAKASRREESEFGDANTARRSGSAEPPVIGQTEAPASNDAAARQALHALHSIGDENVIRHLEGVLANPNDRGALNRFASAVEPALAKAGLNKTQLIAKLAPLLGNPKLMRQGYKELLQLATQVSGPTGRKLVASFLKGMRTSGGSAAHGYAHMIARGARMAQSSGAVERLALQKFGGVAAKGVGRALPVIGNALNVIGLGDSVWQLAKAFGALDPKRIGVRGLHLVATGIGVVATPAALVALAIDLIDTQRPPRDPFSTRDRGSLQEIPEPSAGSSRAVAPQTNATKSPGLSKGPNDELAFAT